MGPTHNLRPPRLPPKGEERPLRPTLEAFLAQADVEALVKNDPVERVRSYQNPHDQEVTGLLLAAMAYGRVQAIKSKADQILDHLGPHPHQAIARPEILRGLEGFVYRFQRGSDFPLFLSCLAHLRKEQGSLAQAFASCVDEEDQDYAPALSRFRGLLLRYSGPDPSRGLRFLLPDAGSGAAAKRLFLYLRWMIRPENGMDLGTFQTLAGPFPTRMLVLPLDTHISRLGRYLGLTRRKSDDLKTAQEMTAALRRLDPEDPLRYDMALCHLGISGACPKQRHPSKCQGCPIISICQAGPRPKNWLSE